MLAEEECHQRHEGEIANHRRRPHVEEERSKVKPRCAPDDDVGRVSDQRGRATDVRGHDLGYEKWHWSDTERIGHE
jgi:hypothetical protein